MKFSTFLEESYYHESLKTYFEKLLKVSIKSESNRDAYDEFTFESGDTLSHFSDLIKKNKEQIYKRLNRQKNPIYDIVISHQDDAGFTLTVNFMVNKFRKKVIYHATHVAHVADIMKNGLYVNDVPTKTVYNESDNKISFLLYKGAFFFGAKSLAKKFAQAKYGNNGVVLMIDNSDSIYNEFSYYEDNSKEKYGYSHSFFINSIINPKNISF